jgi:hypothetical protein
MKTVQEIVEFNDAIIEMMPVQCGVHLSMEEWRTLKAAVLAQQSTNTGSPKCEQCKHYHATQCSEKCQACSHFNIDMFTLRAGA